MGVASKLMWGGRRRDELGVFGTSSFGEREKSHYFLKYLYYVTTFNYLSFPRVVRYMVVEMGVLLVEDQYWP